MSEIKALEKLRKLTICDKGEMYTAYLDAGDIADEIEAEIAERYRELPLDADGVPIRLGDLLDCKTFANDGEKCKSAKVSQLRIDEDETDVMVVLTFDNGMWTCRSANPNKCRHVKPRTLEDVLREMLDREGDGIGLREFNRDFDAFVEHYADEIRAMFGGDAS